MKKKLKILALFDAIAPTSLDQDLSAELKTDDWKTEAYAHLRALGPHGLVVAAFDNEPTHVNGYRAGFPDATAGVIRNVHEAAADRRGDTVDQDGIRLEDGAAGRVIVTIVAAAGRDFASGWPEAGRILSAQESLPRGLPRLRLRPV